MTGIVSGESPRWLDARLWLSDWAAGRVLSVAADGTSTVEAEFDLFPICIDCGGDVCRRVVDYCAL